MLRLKAIAISILLITTAGCTAISDLLNNPDDIPTPPNIQDEDVEDNLTVTITEVVDGDTMDIRYRNGSTDTIRLIGVDTPEVHTDTAPDEFEGIPDTSAGHEWLSGWGKNASTYAETRLAGEHVTIAFGTQTDTRGYYDRLLVYLYIDGELFNQQLLTNGYARVYESEFSKRPEFDDAEATAQANDVGVWSYPDTQAQIARPHPAIAA